MKRTRLINILWVCYLFRPNTECKWLLTVPDSASRLGSGILISFVCVCAALVSSFLWTSLSSFLFLSVFTLCLFVRASCTQGRGCVLKASLHTHQGGSLLFHTQTMTCTFYPAWLDGPLPVSVRVPQDQIGSFIRRFFSSMQSSGKYSFCLCLSFLALCVTRPDSITSSRYCFISGCEWYIISPAGWCELVVSFVISIDESSLGESISSGCSLVAQPPQLAVPNWCLGCLTLPAAP